MSDDLVKRARNALDGVTEGPWIAVEREIPWEIASSEWGVAARGQHIERRIFTEAIHPQGKDHSPVINSATGLGGMFVVISEQDAAFIIAARDLVPAMADRIEQLDAQVGARDPVTLSFCTADEWAEYAAQKDARIEALEAELREARMQSLADGGQAQEAYEAQQAAEADRDAWKANAERLAGALEAAYADAAQLARDWKGTLMGGERLDVAISRLADILDQRAAAHTKQKDGEA